MKREKDKISIRIRIRIQDESDRPTQYSSVHTCSGLYYTYLSTYTVENLRSTTYEVHSTDLEFARHT
jgi:hypothetical protein